MWQLISRQLAIVVLLCGVGPLSVALGQAATNTKASADTNEAEGREILESDRWRRAERGLNEWLSVQQLYSPDEVAVLRSQFRARVARMSPNELRDHLDSMEDKLAVLSSREAEDARRWLAQFLSVQAKYSDEQLRAMRPNVANMTASQIRRELEQFQARRGVTRQTQAAVQQSRAMQAQAAQAARQNQSRPSTAATIGNQNPPPQRNLPGHSEPPVTGRPYYTVGPWGNPIRWDPLAGFW